MVAKISWCFSVRSASLFINWPRSVGDKLFQEGCFKALRAAATAISTSSAPAAYTDTISDSSLEMARAGH
jgi:hypothetical protein